MNPSDTIVAVATAPGRAGVSIVRLSGASAQQVLKSVVPTWDDRTPSHTLKLHALIDPQGDEIDRALVVVMPGPHSFTGEDVVEFQCHGGSIIQRKLIDAAIASGARVAGPGEFTQRAFMNGRLDLTQAEAIADLINAGSDRAHRLALDHLDGSLGEAIGGHLEQIVEAMILVEAALDFSHEEHVYQIERDEIARRVDGVLDGLRNLRDGFDAGRRQREGVRVVILGPPNAGKSTLFNLLVGSERAIVTAVAGTTRDYLEESILIDGLEFRLVDTAGIRDTENEVESIGIERSLELAAIADVVIWLVDATDLDGATGFTEVASQARTTIVVLNKIDAIDRAPTLELDADYRIDTSLIDGRGFERLKATLREVADELSSAEGVLLSRARHFEAVIAAIAALESCRVALDAAMEHELLALDLREALDAIGSIVGEVTTDDILNRIFSDFCVGK